MHETRTQSAPSGRLRTRLSVVMLLALFASGLLTIASAATPAEAQTEAQLVTTNANNPAAWLLRDENGTQTKQWLFASCRQDLEAAGQTVDAIGWSAFGSLPATSNPLTCDAINTLLGGAPPAAGARLVTTNANYPHGWVLVTANGVTTKQWLPTSCRQELEAAGNSFAFLNYNEFGPLPAGSPALSCREIGGLVDGGPAGPTDNFEVVNGRIIDPDGNEWRANGMNAGGGYFYGSYRDAPIIEDRDILLNEWNLNAIRLNVYCLDLCPGSLQLHLETDPTAAFWTLGNADGYVIINVGGQQVRQYVNAACRADLENGGAVFVQGTWNDNIVPFPKADPAVPCAINEDIDAVVQAYAGTGTVIILDNHNNYYPNLPQPFQVRQALDFYTEMAERYKDNPYVWFSPYNEPANECNLARYGAGYLDANGDPLTDQGVATSSWVDIHEPIIEAIRATGNKSVIAPVATNFGQDRCAAGTNGFDRDESVLLNYGPELMAADPEGRIVFDLHFYSRWAESTFDQAEEYFNELQAAGVATFVGETGGQCDNGPLRALHAADLKATALLLENYDTYTYPPQGAFHWTAAGGFQLTTAANGDASRMGPNNDPFDEVTGLGQLSQTGQLFYDFTHTDQRYFSPIPGCA